MAGRTARKNDDSTSTLHCACCGKELKSKDFYKSNSDLYASYGKMPWCKECINKIYYNYLNVYKTNGYANPEKKAVERICMFLDVYFCDDAYNATVKRMEDGDLTCSLISSYISISPLKQYRGGYDRTLEERYNEAKFNNKPISIYSDDDSDMNETIDKAIKLFGNGFDNDDYIFLYNEYCDWTTRHECNTKAQEEVFKQLCFNQLELLKATRAKQDTKDLTATFQKLLDTAKLQPKQNSGDTTSDSQTFGTLIDKWENTRPIPEPEDDLKDVDNIGLYIDTFFRGHLAKMMGLKNGLSRLYDRYMKKYTVEKPEYDNDDDNEALFDAIFGEVIDEDD